MILSGLCQCGCGKKTRVCKKTDRARGIVQGQPRRYLYGHGSRLVRLPSRAIVIDGQDCRTIPLTSGKEAIVDANQFEFVSRWFWHARFSHGTWYATTVEKGKRLHLHNLICPPNKGFIIDHRNGDGLDNRQRNLREATPSQNQQNRLAVVRQKTSQYRGVCWNRACKKWQADLMFQQVNHNLGWYVVEEDAARAYDEAARKYFGDFARLNFPQEGENAATLSLRRRARTM
jgi:hypothetical protein